MGTWAHGPWAQNQVGEIQNSVKSKIDLHLTQNMGLPLGANKSVSTSLVMKKASFVRGCTWSKNEKYQSRRETNERHTSLHPPLVFSF